MKPVRIQRKRSKGWKMPPNTVYVGRPTKWGNPYRKGGEVTKYGDQRPAYSTVEAVAAFREWINACNHLSTIDIPSIKTELRGKNLSCWCPLNQACHADVLLEIANS